MSTIHRVRRASKKSIQETAKRRRAQEPQQPKTDLAEVLGASRSFSVVNKPHGPFAVAALLDEIQSRLVSHGGRPADAGATIRRLVPIRTYVWRTLKAQANRLSQKGRRVSPAQLAAMLVEKSLSELANDQDREGSGRD